MATSPADPSPDLHPGNRSLTRACLVAMIAGCYFSIAAMHILMGLAFVGWVSSSLPTAARSLRVPLMTPILAYLAACSIAALIAWSPTSTRELFSMASPFVIYIMTRDAMAGPRFVHRSVHYVLGCGLIAALIGLSRVAFPTWDIELTGSWITARTYAGALLLAATMIMPRAMQGSRTMERMVLLIAMLIIVWALLMTPTRSAWAGWLVGTGLGLALWDRRAVLLLPAVAIVAYSLMPAPIQEHMRSMANLSHPDLEQRMELWKDGLGIISAHPFVGEGPGLLGEVLLQPEGGQQPVPPSLQHLHNNLLQIGATCGLPALVLWIALWGCWFRHVGRYRKRLASSGDARNRSVLTGCLCALAAFHTMGLFAYNLGDSKVTFLALFIFALPLALEAAEAPNSQPATRHVP